MKKIIIFVVLIVAIVLGWSLISPAFTSIEADEESPLFKDAMDSMSAAEKVEFEVAVSGMSDVVMEMNDDMMGGAQVVASGDFKERAHEVNGKALLIEDGAKQILRFEDFETINGPNLHIYLSSELGDGDFIDLGKIKATNGNVNYEIPPGTDTEKYNKVLVWCVPFKVLFSYADLE
jgi:hypothetical protein